MDPWFPLQIFPLNTLNHSIGVILGTPENLATPYLFHLFFQWNSPTSGAPEAQLDALEGRIKEEKLRLSEAAEQLKTLEEKPRWEVMASS